MPPANSAPPVHTLGCLPCSYLPFWPVWQDTFYLWRKLLLLLQALPCTASLPFPRPSHMFTCRLLCFSLVYSHYRFATHGDHHTAFRILVRGRAAGLRRSSLTRLFCLQPYGLQPLSPCPPCPFCTARKHGSCRDVFILLPFGFSYLLPHFTGSSLLLFPAPWYVPRLRRTRCAPLLPSPSVPSCPCLLVRCRICGLWLHVLLCWVGLRF